MNQILARLPYTSPFLFVDELLEINEDGAKGTFRFSKNLDFYQGHFKENPITPGVILTECCAQIGLVCLGIFLLENENASLHIEKSGAKRHSNKESHQVSNAESSDKVSSSSEANLNKKEFPYSQNLQIGMSSSQMEFLLPVLPGEQVTVSSQKLYFRFNKLKCKVKMYNGAGKLVCKGEIAGMIG